jgi:hypothetical protein
MKRTAPNPQGRRHSGTVAVACLKVAISAVLFLGLSCPKPVLPPPSPAQDAPPTVNIGYIPKATSSGSSGAYEYTTQGGLLNLPTSEIYHDYLVTAAANDPLGGVKEIVLTISQSGRVLQSVKNTQTPDANGQVAPNLVIIGTNNAGGPGAYGILATAGISPVIEATVTATNFNGQSSTISAMFNVIPGPPMISNFSASPNGGYINVGQTATLTWDVSCGVGAGACNVALRGMDGVNYSHQVLYVPALGFSGTFNVTPTWSTLTKYTLTVTNAGAGGLAVSKSVVVQLYAPPQGSGLQPFYFRMSGPSWVNPCFVVVEYATDQTSAQAMAESQYGGYTATAITEQGSQTAC